MNKGPSLRMEIDALKAEGNFFTKDVTKTISDNTKDAVEWLAKRGPGIVSRYAAPRSDTGFTADVSHWEGFASKRSRIITGAPVASLYGKVRMRQGLSRPVSPGTSSKYGPERRPYITNAVLESGSGGDRRTPNRHVRRAAARLRGFARAIRIDLTKGLE